MTLVGTITRIAEYIIPSWLGLTYKNVALCLVLVLEGGVPVPVYILVSADMD